MKKYFYSVLAASMLFATSCSQDQEIVDITKGEGQKVTFKVEIPEDNQSRAINLNGQSVEIGKGQLATRLIYAQYEEGTTIVPTTKPLVTGIVEDDNNDGIFTVELTMAKDINYDVLFMAYNPENNIFGIPSSLNQASTKANIIEDAKVDLRNLQVKYSLSANQEAYDAFVGVMPDKNIKDPNRNVELHRPFAQVNAVVTYKDLYENAYQKLGIQVTHSSLKINDAPNTYNVYLETTDGEVDLEYQTAPVMKEYGVNTYPNQAVFDETKQQYYLATAYVLAGADKKSDAENLTAEFKFYRGENPETDCISTLSIPQLPVQRNYRTNVIGELLTKTEAYTITIEEGFANNDHIVNEFNATSESIDNVLDENKSKTEALSYNVEVPTTENNVSITIPDDTKAASLSFNLKNLSANATVTITNKDRDNDSYSGPVVVEVPVDVNLNNLTIELPSAHVTIKQGNFVTVVATTSNTTLVIPNGVTIANLEIKGGNAEIYYGTVTNLTKSKGYAGTITWTVDSKEQLTKIATEVNNGKNFAKETIKLTGDIDLNNEEWTPIGKGQNHFMGTFDGNNHIIRNLKITGRNTEGAQAALFGTISGTPTFKDFTLENVNIVYPKDGKDFYAAALVGTYYGTIVVDNVDVVNANISGNNKVAGLMAHDGVCTQLTIKNCDIKNSTIASEDNTDGGSVGGILGYFQGSSDKTHEISNTTVTECTIKGINSSNTGMRANSEFIGGIDNDQAYTLKIEGCTIENNTFTDVKGDGSAVTFVSPFAPYQQYIGGFRNENAVKCTIIINGETWVANGLWKKSNEYLVSNANGLVALSKTTINGGENVLLTSNIDLNGIEFNGLNAFNPENNNTFDGQNYTVSNWTYAGKVDDMGFIKNWVGTIKNLTIMNANLQTGGRSAVIAAKPYGNIENCHVVECELQANYWACGLITGMHNAGNMKNCTAKESSITSTGGTGAITGVLNETSGTRTYEGCEAINCTINNGGDDPYAGAAIIGLINIDNATVNLKKCKQSNNTFQGTTKDEFVGYNAGDNTTVTIE